MKTELYTLPPMERGVLALTELMMRHRQAEEHISQPTMENIELSAANWATEDEYPEMLLFLCGVVFDMFQDHDPEDL